MSGRGLALLPALVLALSAVASAAPAQSGGALPNGGQYVLRPDPSAPTASLALWFHAPSDGYADPAPGIAQLAAAACAAVRPAGGTSLSQQVNALGGRLTFGGEADMIMVDVSVPAGAARRALAALTAAYFTPKVDDDAYRLALRDTAVRAVERNYATGPALTDLLMREMFASGPAHVPALPGSAGAIARIPMDRVAAFAATAFRSGNAFLALAGNVDAADLDAIADGDAAASQATPFDDTSTLAPAGGEATVDGQEAAIVLGFAGPPITDRRAATALDFIAGYLFDPDTGLASKEFDGTDTVLGGHFLTLRHPGVTVVTISGGDLDAAKAKVLAALDGMRRPLPGAAFAAARRAFAYRSATGWSQPPGLADDLAWYALQGDAAYAPGDATGVYAAAIESLDPAYVAQIARTYLAKPSVVRVVAREGAAS